MEKGTSTNDVSDHGRAGRRTSPRLRARIATAAAHAATWASRKSGRGAGGMIGGLIAQKIDPRILASLGKGRPAAIITGTNGKSTTTRMFAAAMRAAGHSVATNEGGDNMDAGIISALLATPDADSLVLEVDELHVPHIAADLKPQVLVLLNLSRDQLDRVGEINKIEATLREAVDANPQATVVANCDDPLIASAAWDAKKVIWVSAGGGWTNDATSSPRTGGPIIQDGRNWYAVKPLPDGSEFKRPEPDFVISPEGVTTPAGETLPLNLTLPGNANRGNATMAIAGAIEMGAELRQALNATETVDNVAGRYSTMVVKDAQGGEKHVRMLLAKNPAGWQEALSMVDRTADAVVIAVNGHVADGEDLSWLWDVRFEDFDGMEVVASGERGTDLGVRLLYADIDARLVADPLQAIRECGSQGPSSSATRVEVLANYTAFRDLKRDIERAQEVK
ncbi:MAG: MurT ligase domain-containing protein [Corynebacterium sp.]|uniref:Mur ligase family protein n=1 Tax=Corynebacterium sp. TaxID=1720 RepID=UPI0026DCB3CD|nr:MurT ligase domain-containing protein [Corynebacterium sp.]MDO5030925.1 MurT ligase domain-containing protein [Corynebacterium sp.]